MPTIKNYIINIVKRNSVKNGLWLYGLQFFNSIIPLFTLPYIMDTLGTSEFGVFSIALNFIGYLQVVIEYGFGMTATRALVVIINKQKEDSKRLVEPDAVSEARRLFSSVFFSRLLLVIVSGAILAVYILIKMPNTKSLICLLIMYLGIICITFQENWFFQGVQEMKYISIANILARTISMILIFLLVKTENDLFLYCILYSCTTTIGALFGFFTAVIKYKMRLVRVAFSEIIQTIKEGWYVFTTSMSGKIFGSIGVFFMGFFSPDSESGIYSAIQKIPLMMNMAWAPISQVLFPISSQKLAGSYVEGKRFIGRTKRIVLPLFAAISLLIGLFSRYIILFVYNEECANNFYWIFPQLCWLLVGIDNNFNGIQLLIGSGHAEDYSKCFMIGLIATIVCNFAFVIALDGTGASIAPLLSELLLNLLIRIKIRKIETQSAVSID